MSYKAVEVARREAGSTRGKSWRTGVAGTNVAAQAATLSTATGAAIIVEAGRVKRSVE
jgi:hypothetical protein